VLSACGDPITANHDWQSVSALITVSATVGATTEAKGTLLAGVLVNAQKAPIIGTQFVEKCAKLFKIRPVPAGTTATDYSCLTSLNTGLKFYVAGGLASGPFSTFKSLDHAGSLDTIVISPIKKLTVKGTPAGVLVYLVKISARKG
jgi:hypothetical protein